MAIDNQVTTDVREIEPKKRRIMGAGRPDEDEQRWPPSLRPMLQESMPHAGSHKPVGSSRSKDLDALKSRYTCIHEPLPPAAYSASSDDHQRYLTSLWVFGSREVEEPQSPLHISTGPNSCLYTNQKIEMTRDKIFLEQPTVPSSGELRYMNYLWVSQNVEPEEELHQSDLLQSITNGSLDRREITYKIRSALKILPFREQHVIVQFWSPHDVGKHQLLTIIDQPFGLGVVGEELCFYRKDTEHKALVENKYHEEDPPARVFRWGLPEWTSDLVNCKSKDFPQRDCAIRCNLHGYLALPVFDSATGLCVGVLELLTSSKLKDVAYEVDHIHRVLKTWNLTSPQAFEVFDGPALNDSNGSSKNESDKICDILKHVGDIHGLPLALTWTLSPSTSYFAHEKVIEKSCSSFNSRCFRKVCMSAALPYYVGDMRTWEFMQASKKRHLDMSRGVAGRALSSRGSCFCEDVTELDEEEYPLVHNARMTRLTSCFAIFLHSVEGDNDYVLEFFLPLDMKDSRHVPGLIQTLKQSVDAASGFELGDGSFADISVKKKDSSDFESSVVTDASETHSANVVDQWVSASTSAGMESICDNFTDTVENLFRVNVTYYESMERFIFSCFDGLSKWEIEVAKRFNLEGQGLHLKYRDEDNDLIVICLDQWRSLNLKFLENSPGRTTTYLKKISKT